MAWAVGRRVRFMSCVSGRVAGPRNRSRGPSGAGCAVALLLMGAGVAGPTSVAAQSAEADAVVAATADAESAPESDSTADEVVDVPGPASEQPAEPARADAGADAGAGAEEAGLPELSAEDLAAIEVATSADAAALAEAGAGPDGVGGTADGDDAAADPLVGDGSLGNQGAARRGGIFQTFNPDLSFIADIAFAWFSDDDNLQTGAHDPVANGFNLQQFEMSISAAVDPYFRVDANIVFGEFGVEIEEVYGTTLGLPAQLQARVGQFLTRFGRTNNTHPHSWDFVDQPFAVGRVMGAEGNRGLGLELSWLTPLPWYVEVLASGTDASGEATARSFYGANDLGVNTLADFQYTVAAKSFHPLSDDWSFFWGGSAAFGPNGTGRDNRTDLYGGDVYLKWRPIRRQSFQVFSLTGEAFYRRRQVPEDVLSDVSMYASAYWRLAQRWAVAARYEFGSPARGQDGTVSQDDYLDPEWIDARHRGTANLTFWPTEFTRIRVQGSVDLPTWRDEPVWAGFLALELVTGAHGAHEF